MDLASQQLLARSVIRLATTTNERADTSAAVSFPTSNPLLVGHAELTPNADMIVFDPLDHTGYDDNNTTMLPIDNPTPTVDLSTIQIGTKLSVYWPDDDKFYQGTITSITPSGLYHVSYDDGDLEELDLHKERFILTPSSTPPIPDNRPDMDIDTTPDTDESTRWKMVKILSDKQVRPHKTELQVQWDSGEISWLPLSIVKRADPHLFNDYALTAHGHWANHFRSRRRQFLTSTKHIFTSSTVLFKYCHRLPRSHKELLEIDRQLGNSLWADAIQK